MKPPFVSSRRILGVAALAVLSLSFSSVSHADDRPRGFGSVFGRSDRDGRHDRDRGRPNREEDERRRRYFAAPRTSFIITLGDGYAGRGYYYGPPNMPYYYKGDGISYYSRRDSVPQRYWGSSRPTTGSADVAVQRALTRLGYYRGPVDGDIGPGTRASIARYQRDRGLRVTGVVDSTLLRSLGL